jgi:hypothetical protein
MRLPFGRKVHTVSDLDLSALSQVGREAIERGDNPRSLGDLDKAAYDAAVEESGEPDPTLSPLGSADDEGDGEG